MGYRNYLSRIPKSVYEEIKDLSTAELCKKYDGEDNYFSVFDIPELEDIHELGKYCDFPIDDLKSDFFTKYKDSDCECSIAKKELLLALIEDYRVKVLSWYQNLKDEPLDKHIIHTKTMINEWGGSSWEIWPYDIDEKNKTIVSSWKYEYEVFELVRILKSFDWENDVLIYRGF
jgi:hypothetical protein